MNIEIISHQQYRLKLDTMKPNNITHEHLTEYKEKIQSMRIFIEELKNQTTLYENELMLQQKVYRKIYARYMYKRKKCYWATHAEKKKEGINLNLSFD